MARYTLYGSALSPFSLKARALCRHAALPHRWIPDASVEDTWRAQRRRLALSAGLAPVTYPPRSPLDDTLPLVPFLFGDDGTVVIDSSAMGRWLDGRLDGRGTRLLPEDPGARWACALIDEAIDEVGLYLLHHHRWVTSGPDTWAPERLAFELDGLLGPLARPFATRFAARQVRRLPYLFSVAPPGFTLGGVRSARTPPARRGFPPTHALLDALLDRWLDVLEPLLASRPYLLGERFTLADASLYGMMASILALDPSTRARVMARAPTLVGWIARVEEGTESRGEVAVDGALAPLLHALGGAFVPLMIQNEAAWRRARDAGTSRFNEAAFDRGEALYDGELLGHPFRSVAKTFQVRVWRDLVDGWLAMSAEERRVFEAFGPCFAAIARGADEG